VSEQGNIDAGILMRERRGKSRSIFANPGLGLFRRGWVEANAEVVACSTPVSWRYNAPRMGGEGSIRPLPYVVTFRYEVKGKSYEGIINSPDKIKRGDTFTIRYDPRHPETNNTFDSQTDWTYTYTTIFSVVMLLLMSVVFIWSYFFRA
jgi:hypothetical protein